MFVVGEGSALDDVKSIIVAISHPAVVDGEWSVFFVADLIFIPPIKFDVEITIFAQVVKLIGVG